MDLNFNLFLHDRLIFEILRYQVYGPAGVYTAVELYDRCHTTIKDR